MKVAIRSVFLVCSFIALAWPLCAATVGYVYVNAEGSVVGYAVDETGTLAAVPGSPYATVPSGSNCDVMTAVYDETRGVLYVSNPEAASVSAFAVNPVDGSLTVVPGSPFSLSGGNSFGAPAGLAIDATRQYLYVGKGYGGGSPGLDGFTIGANGSLTVLPGSPFGVGIGQSGFVALNDPVENTIITGTNGDDLTIFDVAPDGALSQIAGSPFINVACNMHGLAMHPARRELAIGDACSGTARGYGIAPGGGIAGPQTSEQFGARAGLRFTPDGTRLYASAWWENRVFGYDVTTGPIFSPASWTSVTLPFSAVNVTLSDDGALLFANGWGSLRSFTLGAGGLPTPVSTVTFSSGGCGSGIAFVSLDLDTNTAPVLDAISNKTTQWGALLTFTANATDTDGDTLSYSMNGAPTGATIDSSTGVFEWTPTSGQIGTHSVEIVVTDDGTPAESDSETVDIEVTKRETALAYSGATTGDCSDPVTLIATLTDAGPGDSNGDPIAGATIDFILGSQSTSAVTDASGVATAILVLDQALGAATVVAAFDDDYENSSDSSAFTVSAESVDVLHNTEPMVSTSCTTCTNATVTFHATLVQEDDGSPADLTEAVVNFLYRDGNPATPDPVICTAAAGLVNPSDPLVATATCNASVPEGSYTIGVVVIGGCFDSTVGEDDLPLTVVVPVANTVSGGGYLLLTDSNGSHAGADGTKANFGFNVKYSKNGKNLQGTMNVIVRNGARVYQIKAIGMGSPASSLTVKTSAGTAVFNSRASISDITDPLNLISVDSNASLQVAMTDNGERGSSDTIGITVYNKSGGLWFSSNWNGTKTLQQTIAGGNLQVK